MPTDIRLDLNHPDPSQRQGLLVSASRQTLQPAGERPCCVTQWVPFEGSSSLLGKATVAFRNGLIIAGVPVFRKASGDLSVGAPSCPVLAADGIHATDPAGKKRYAPAISFAGPEAKRRWEGVILAALADAGMAGAAS